MFLAAFAAVAFFDLRKMRRAGLKRELVPYLCMTAAAVFVAVLFYPQPYRQSIIGFIMRVFHLKSQ
jgi:hypothetical protein